MHYDKKCLAASSLVAFLEYLNPDTGDSNGSINGMVSKQHTDKCILSGMVCNRSRETLKLNIQSAI